MESNDNNVSPGLLNILLLGFGILGAARTVDTVQQMIRDDLLPTSFWEWLHAATGPLMLIVARQMYVQMKRRHNSNGP